MEGFGIILVIFVVIVVGWILLEKLVDGAVTGLFALIAAPFRAAGKAREKATVETYVNGLQFDTSTPATRLHAALSEHFRKGEFHPGNRVILQSDEPGRFVVGIAWHEEMRFTLENGQSVPGSGLPVVVAELTLNAAGQRTVGRVRLTRFSHDPDWTDKAIMENTMPWCLEPVQRLDPAAQITRVSPVAGRV